MKRILPFILCLMLAAAAMAQTTDKVTLQTRMLTHGMQAKTARAAATDNQTAEVVIQLDETIADATLAELRAAGLTLHGKIGRQVSATMPLSALGAVEQLAGVTRIATYPIGYQLHSDVTRREIRSDQIDGEAGHIGDQPYTGKGVTVVVIDTGFDFQHPAFLDAEGRSRIKAVYMPSVDNGTGVEIDGMTLPGTLYDTPEQIAQLTTDVRGAYHGSHTATIAAGTRSPQGFGGMAPDADIVLCCTDKDSDPNENVSIMEIKATRGLFHSLAFISHYARQSQQPVVVNGSLGINIGSHDGKGVMTEAFEALCQQGVPVVLSAGNEGDAHITLHKVFESDDDVLRTMMTKNSALLEGYVYEEAPLSMQLSLVQKTGEDDNYNPIYTPVWQSPVLDADRGSLYELNSADDATLAEGFDGELHIGVLKSGGATQLACYFQGEYAEDFGYAFELTVRGKQGTELYLFGERLHSLDLEGYSDSESILTMNDWSTAPDVISVGAYSANATKRSLFDESEDKKNVLYDVAEFSSWGTGFNGVHCPTLCAPGVNVVSATSHYYLNYMKEQMEKEMGDDESGFDDGYGDYEYGDDGYDDDGYNISSYKATDDDNSGMGSDFPIPLREEMMWNGFHYTCEEGTSQSAPAVAGTIALWLQADPSLTVTQIRDILVESCRTDEWTEASPERFGHGKLDARRGLELVLEQASTGIRQAAIDRVQTDSRLFLPDGRQVTGHPQPGLYITGGKKVVVK